MALTGSAGGATAAVEGRFRGERANWQEGEIELSGEMDAKSSALLAAITGLQLYERSDRPTRFAGSVSGTLSGGLATTLEAELFGTKGSLPAPSGKGEGARSRGPRRRAGAGRRRTVRHRRRARRP
jgi:hypothetical protein